MMPAGQHVEVSDPLGYSGPGRIVASQERPTAAYLVRLSRVTDRQSQAATTRDVWVLAPHVRAVDAGT